MAGVQEENRRRIALLLISLGALLIAVGITMGLHHAGAANPTQEAVALARGPASLSKHEEAKLIQQILFLLVVLVGILAVSLYALKVWSRRFRQMLLRKPASPTPSEDVWAMHRLPEDSLGEDLRSPEGN